jgi:D-sedoheptulose 7-phosphate isomerase
VQQQIQHWFQDSAETKLKFAVEHGDRIKQVADVMVEAFRRGNKILLFGNGGSAMDASHIAAEFVGRYRRDRQPLAALSLSADQAKLTCIANDYDFTEIFARQVQALGRPHDVAIGISTSGNSPNVLKGLQVARQVGMTTVGWTGGTGGKLVALVDYAFIVPSTVVARIQETHVTLGHVLCELIDEALLGKE